MDELILNAIRDYNKARRMGASFFHIESKFPELNYEEISEVLKRLTDGGEILKQNYLYYPKKD